MSRHRYGQYRKHIELFEMFEGWREDEEVQSALAEEMGWDLQESTGTGAPEGRADFPLFMLTQIRHTMREGFKRRSGLWQQYMGFETAQDFRTHTTSQLNGLSGMGPVMEGEEYPRIRSGEEEGPPYAIGKHGGVYGVTFEMIVDDDPGLILNRTPREMGRMNAAYISRAVVALIESNPNYIDGNPFFSATPRLGLPAGNEVTSTAAVPNETNLVAICAGMRNTVDSEGLPIEIDPRWVLTKSEVVRLELKRVLRSQETGVQDTGSAEGTFNRGTLNPLYGDSLMPSDAVIVDPMLQDPNDWIVLADTGRAAFRIAFYRDQREPFIGIQDPGVRSTGGGSSDPYDLNIDEMKFKLRMLFGVALGDPRSAWRARQS